jgi:hypothetical protein
MQRAEVAPIVANDLEIYFRGFEVALKRRNIEDALRYLESMIEQIDYTSDCLQPLRNHRIEIDTQKRYIEKTISDYRTRIEHLQAELRSL